MAESGGKRRKLGIELDFDKLLPSGDGDDEPLLLVIRKNPQKSKPLSELMDEGTDDCGLERDIKNMTDDELKVKTARLKSNSQLISRKLKDGGEKYRLSLAAHEAELERRRTLQADGKCSASSPVDVPGNDGDDSHSGAPYSLPNSASAFALRFCSKLDENNATKSFSDQLSVLNADCQNKHLPHKICMSSRPSPFRSPYHIADNNDDDPKENTEQSPSSLSSSFFHRGEKETSGSLQKRKYALRFRPPRKSTMTNKALVLVDEEESGIDVRSKRHKVDRSKDRRIYYPSRDDPEAIEIYYSDLENLAPESYLSSTIMNFYIRYLQKPTYNTENKLRDYHFFNTYFYEKLKGDVLNKADREAEAAFVKFRRWWKGVNIFEKATIFLPIYEKEHWSLVIISIPAKETGSKVIIFHLDSLGFHASQPVFRGVKRFLVEEWKFLRKEGSIRVPVADHIWENLPRRINDKAVEVPQQSNVYDCGLFVLYFIERFIEASSSSEKEDVLAMFGREWFRPEEASDLRHKIKDLLIQEFHAQHD